MARNLITHGTLILLITSAVTLLPTPSLSESPAVRNSLVQFMNTLSDGGEKLPKISNWGWNATSDPCTAKWAGVICDEHESGNVTAVILDGHDLGGVLDAGSLCAAESLAEVSLRQNNIRGPLPAEIAECRNLAVLILAGNRFSGPVPADLDYSRLKGFDVSDNNFTGPIPGGLRNFSASGFGGNPGLCGSPLPVACPPAPATSPAA